MKSMEQTAEILRIFLIQRNKLSLNGIGMFELLRTPARFNASSGILEAPSYRIQFKADVVQADTDLYAYLSRAKNLPEWDAITQVEMFCREVKGQLLDGLSYEWPGLGTILMEGNKVHFYPLGVVSTFQTDIKVNGTLSYTPDIAMDSSDSNSEESEGAVQTALWKWGLASIAVASLALIILHAASHGRFTAARSGKVNLSITPPQSQSKPAE